MTTITLENTLIIIPAYNEAESISEVINELKSLNYNVLVVSDGSWDTTCEIARGMGVRVLELPINLGVGGALRAGFRFAVREKYAAVVQVDADGQHPADEIADLMSAANQNHAHLVIGSRFLSNETSMVIGLTRQLVMRVLARSSSRATGTKITDTTSGFRIICEPLLTKFSASFPTYYLGDTYEAVVAAGRSGHKVMEIPAALRQRTAGESTASILESVRFTVKGLAVSALRLHHRLERYHEKNLDVTQ
jgi:glycosyltransferase involved in cell wall biosynthesis